MRISDWSSDVCSSDLPSGEAVFVRKIIDELDEIALRSGATLCPGNGASAFLGDVAIHSIVDVAQDRVGAVMYDIRGYTPSWGSLTSYMSSILPGGGQIGRASCRERVCQ